jgi:hypothetical protein
LTGAQWQIRRPATFRPFSLSRHRLGARPREAIAADTDAVADRLAAAEGVIEKGLLSIDDYGAGRRDRR